MRVKWDFHQLYVAYQILQLVEICYMMQPKPSMFCLSTFPKIPPIVLRRSLKLMKNYTSLSTLPLCCDFRWSIIFDGFIPSLNLFAYQAHWELFIGRRFNKSVFNIISTILFTLLFTIHFFDRVYQCYSVWICTYLYWNSRDRLRSKHLFKKQASALFRLGKPLVVTIVLVIHFLKMAAVKNSPMNK